MRRAADALAGLDGPRDPLGLADDLRRRLAGPLAQRAAELHDARYRALGRFPGAETGFFTRKGVEQMTRAPVAAVRAAWILERLGRCTVLDATCGVGGDSVALAAAGLTAISMDRDFGSVLCASENLRARSLPDRTLVGDACHPPLWAPFGVDVLLLDPDRRPDGARTADPRGWSPTLEQALAQAVRYRGACIKLPPALDPAVVSASLAGLSAGEALAWSLAWIEADRELCEVSLWTGELAQGPSEVRSALVLGPGPLERHARIEGMPEEVPWLAPGEAASIRWLAEPGPAVVRSGLIGLLARRVGMAPARTGDRVARGPGAARFPLPAGLEGAGFFHSRPAPGALDAGPARRRSGGGLEARPPGAARGPRAAPAREGRETRVSWPSRASSAGMPPTCWMAAQVAPGGRPWWAMRDSNSRLPPCKGGTLPLS